MRPLVVAVLLTLSASGCATVFGGGGSTDVVQSVSISADSLLRVATTQLQHHGFVVTPVGDRSVFTTPRPVPTWLVEKDATMKDRQWVVEVHAAPHFLARGTRLEVTGYMLPESSTRPAAGSAPNVQNAIEITSKHALYPEVRAVAGWIADAARRK